MNILQIGTTDKRGGAAAISWYIKSFIDRLGGRSTMLVADKISDDNNVFIIKRPIIRRYLGFLLSIEDLYKTDWILKTKEFKEADIVHCHNLHGRFFNLNTLKKMSLLKPVVWTLHDEWAITPHCAYTFEGKTIKGGFFECPSKKTPQRLLWNNEKYLRYRKNWLYNKSNLNIITPCKWLKNRVEKSVLKNQNINLIYNGIDIKKFHRIDKIKARKMLNLPLDKKIGFFLSDGVINNPWKGWKYTKDAIKNFKNNNDILFLCAGDKPEDLIKSEINIKYTGYIDNSKLYIYYSACDFFITTTLAENFPLVVLEAMSCGLPIISFDTGGIKEVVEHEKNGFIARYRNTDDIISGIKFICRLDNIQIKKIEECNINKIKNHFSLDKMLYKYLNLYKNILKNYEKK